jgi:hypothetical protein
MGNVQWAMGNGQGALWMAESTKSSAKRFCDGWHFAAALVEEEGGGSTHSHFVYALPLAHSPSFLFPNTLIESSS